MSGIFDSLFGTKEKTKETTTPFVALPPISFNTTTGGGAQLQSGIGGGFVTTRPGIKTSQNTFGQNTLGQLGRLGNTIGRLGSNQNPFIQARVNPLRNEMANRRADLSRSISQRGVVGALGNNELMKFDRNADMQVGDATALATQEALGSLLAAEGEYRGANKDVLNLADAFLRQDITELGLNLEALNTVLSSRLTGQTGTASGSSRDIMGSIGAVLGIGREAAR